MKKVLLIGPSLERTKGGMATSISNILRIVRQEKVFAIEHLVTHVEGAPTNKIKYFLQSLHRILFHSKFDLVHIHVASGASFFRKSVFVLLALLKKKPVLLHLHSGRFDTFYQEAVPFVRWYIKFILQHCNQVVVVTDLLKTFLLENMQLMFVEVVENGIDPKVFQYNYTLASSNKSFIFLGRLKRQKGIYDLLEAVNIIVNTKKLDDLFFYIAGDGETEAVKAFIDNHRLQRNVQLMGWLDEKGKIECLKKGASVVLPSYSEGLPFSLLEGMAAGKVIITTEVGSIPSLVVENENGFLVKPGEIERLVDCIMHIVLHPEIIPAISKNNIQKIKSHYDENKFRQRLFSIYKHLLN